MDFIRDPGRRRAGLLASLLVGGLGLVALGASLGVQRSLPLYDGVVVVEPYRYLQPTSGQRGDPTSASLDLALAGAPPPPIEAATTESPPQAQLIAGPDSLVPPTGSQSLKVSIRAVPPPGTPSSGTIEGNVYAFELTTDVSGAVRVAAGQLVSIVLRAPSGSPTATIERYANGVWEALATEAAGLPDMYIANVTAFGDMALVSGRHAPTSSQGSGSAGPTASIPPPSPSQTAEAPSSAPPSAAPSLGSTETASAIPGSAPASSAAGGLSPLLVTAGLAALVALIALGAVAVGRRRAPPGGRLGR
jgi:hypothetical protein